MTRTTDRRLSLGAMALVVVINGITLGGAWYNRTGEPSARLQLTEREVAVPHARLGSDEDSGLALQLVWQVDQRSGVDGESSRHAYGRRADWLDAEKLRALGFDLPPATGATSERRGGDPLAREAWLLLEFDGESHQRALREAEQLVSRPRDTTGGDRSPSITEAEERLRRVRDVDSRLYVIDADLDRDALRQRHAPSPDLLVVRGRIDIVSFPGHDERARPFGIVQALAIEEIHVPKAWRTLFEGLSTARSWKDRTTPRYTVTLAWGRRFEPWLEHAAPLP